MLDNPEHYSSLPELAGAIWEFWLFQFIINQLHYALQNVSL